MKDKSFIEHLEDFRKTLLYIVIIVGIAFFASFSFGDFISEILLTPLRDILGGSPADLNGKIVYIGLVDKILSQFQVSLWFSIIVSSPFWFYQLWLFLKPGLYDREVNVLRPFMIMGFVLFCLGVSFGYWAVLPSLIKTFTEFGVQNIEATIGLKDYLVLASKLLVLCGAIFQLPNIILILGLVDIADHKVLKKYRKYIYMAFSVLSGLITPPDILSMLILWLPLILLFELGVILSWIFVRFSRNGKNITSSNNA